MESQLCGYWQANRTTKTPQASACGVSTSSYYQADKTTKTPQASACGVSILQLLAISADVE